MDNNEFLKLIEEHKNSGGDINSLFGEVSAGIERQDVAWSDWRETTLA